MTFAQLAFSFKGRMRRRDFWLGQILLAFVVGFVGMILIGGLGAPASLGAVVLLLAWPAVAIAVKRGHDRNRPAAWIIGLYGLDVAVSIVPTFNEAFRPLVRAGEIAVAAYVIVDLGLLDGAKAVNRYGPSPKTPDSTADAIA
jgi:uncharacterized membrane protein YhaH (DUF805 family)